MTAIRMKWYLLRYARHVGNVDSRLKSTTPSETVTSANATSSTAVTPSSAANQQKPEEWKFFDGNSQELVMVLTDQHHLVVTYKDTIQENMSLWNAQNWMRGTQKGDSVLLIYKCKEESRRFRVKFAVAGGESGVSVCNDWVRSMQAFFPIKQLAVEAQADKHSPEIFEGDVSVGRIAEVLSSGAATRLPEIYNSLEQLPPTQLSTMLRLCLTDAHFPAFVGQVEREIANLVKETGHTPTNK